MGTEGKTTGRGPMAPGQAVAGRSGRPQTAQAPPSLGLVSAPWPLFNRPSIQLGSLKAYLAHHLPRAAVSVYPLYLRLAEAIGYGDYQRISEHMWLAESVFAALLTPDRCARPQALFRKEARRLKITIEQSFDQLAATADQVSREFAAMIARRGHHVVGFSICLCQFSASVHLIRLVKGLRPDTVVVIGGSALAAESVQGVLAAFPEVDYAITGEGEKPLAGLIRHLHRHGPASPHDPAIAGVHAHGRPAAGAPGAQQLESLAELPPPDYSAYFRDLDAMAPEHRFFPVLPVEISRGCRWQSGCRSRGKPGCAFCNLNRLWQGYRAKTPDQVLGEIDTLTARHQVLSLSLTDNLLPADAGRAVFAPLSRLGKDLDLFGEIRATTAYEHLTAMAAAGMRELQVGIEALSPGLLKRLNKGTRVIQNLQIMKDCQELGIRLSANLILHFPGSSDEEVAETLSAIAFAIPFRPLKPVSFWLGLGSPVCDSPGRFGIRSVGNHHNYRYLLPKGIRDRIDAPIKSYRGDRTRQIARWQPVRQALKTWRRHYDRMQRRDEPGANLSYRDGGRFLVLRQRQPAAETVNHRLTGDSRRIYLYCRRHRSIQAIRRRFPQVPFDRLEAFLALMARKRLMFSQGDRHLSLAVHEPACGRRLGLRPRR
jgi:ribosomal peptide maturation radical SAM protein 1